MTVVEIKRAKKHLCEIVFEEESVLLDSEIILLERINVGTVVSEEQLETLKYKSEFTRAKNKALWLVSRRDYSKKELLSKLKPDFDEQPSLEAVELLEYSGVVDDNRFAENYAYDLSNFKKLSAQGIKYELIRKGIDKEIADEISSQFIESNSENLSALINLKYKGFQADEKIKRRMFNALIRKGYSYSDINRAINEFEENF